MAASDYMVGNAPGGMSYGAGNMAQQLFGMISGLPDEYFKGTQQARALNLQKPILGPDGQPSTDFNILAQELVRRGGSEYAQTLLPYLWKNEQLRNEEQPQPWQTTRPTEPASQHPRIMQQAAAALGPSGTVGQRQPLSSMGSDNAGTDTVRQIAAELHGSQEVGADIIERYALAAGAQPRNGMMAADQELIPKQAARAREIIGARIQRMGAGPNENNEPTPVGAGANAGGAGIPAITPSPQGGFGNRFPSYPGGPPATEFVGGPGGATGGRAAPGVSVLSPGAALVPPGWLQGQTAPGYEASPEGFARYADSRARRLSIIGDVEGGKIWASHAQAVREAIGKATELTPSQKDAGASSMTPLQYEAQKAEQSSRATADTKFLGDLSEQGIAAQKRNAALDAVDELGKRSGYGLGAKMTEFLGDKLGIPLKGFDDVAAYTKAIGFLAPQLRPEGSGRLIEWELANFRDSLGGLMTTPNGRRMAIQNLKLVNDYSVALGRVANDPNASNAQKRAALDSVPVPKLALPVRDPNEYAALPVGHPYLDLRPGSPNQGAVLRKMPPRQQPQSQ